MKTPRIFTVPASESHLALALALCVFLLSVLLWGIIWQADVIGYQREVIRWLWNARWTG
ncbi:MAG: hypothetical protein K6U09_09300 [Acidobacteriia bacterium]|nr:hypothetical protein [Terriglobia bacterium]